MNSVMRKIEENIRYRIHDKVSNQARDWNEYIYKQICQEIYNPVYQQIYDIGSFTRRVTLK